MICFFGQESLDPERLVRRLGEEHSQVHTTPVAAELFVPGSVVSAV